MPGKYDFQPGDVIRLKKKHPCGSFQWKVLRTGADLRMQCMGCGRMITQDRTAVEKNTRELTRPDTG